MESRRLTPDERLLVMPDAPMLDSRTLGWSGLAAERRTLPFEAEVVQPPLTHHQILFYFRASERLFRECGALRSHGLPPPGSISVVPAGWDSAWHWQGNHDVLSVFLPPPLLERAAEECGTSARWQCRPVFDVLLPQARPVLLALAAELEVGGPGGALCAESLAVALAVHLVRYFQGLNTVREVAPEDSKIRLALEYIQANLAAQLRLADVAAAAGLSSYHFLRLFKRQVGTTPHRYVIAQRVERARHLLCSEELSLAQIAQSVGFSDQSHLTRHFKRLVGVPPSRCRQGQ